MSNKVLNHPNSEEIIKKLVNGESVKQVEKWLRSEYPRTKKRHISFVTLQNFRKNYLNLEGQVLADIKEAKGGGLVGQRDLQAKALVAGSNAYKEKLESIVDEKIDVTQKLIQMESLISARMEYYFNQLQAHGDLKTDKVFLDYIKAQQEIMRDWKKMIEGMADKKIEHNININVINEQITVLKGVVYETLRELDPRLIPVFIEKLNSKMGNVQYNSQEYDDYQAPLKIIEVEYDED